MKANKNERKTEEMNRLTIKEWQLLKGIKLKNIRGFKESKNKVHKKLYTKGEFRKFAKKCEIAIKTEKGLEFLASKS